MEVECWGKHILQSLNGKAFSGPMLTGIENKHEKSCWEREDDRGESITGFVRELAKYPGIGSLTGKCWAECCKLLAQRRRHDSSLCGERVRSWWEYCPCAWQGIVMRVKGSLTSSRRPKLLIRSRVNTYALV